MDNEWAGTRFPLPHSKGLPSRAGYFKTSWSIRYLVSGNLYTWYPIPDYKSQTAHIITLLAFKESNASGRRQAWNEIHTMSGGGPWILLGSVNGYKNGQQPLHLDKKKKEKVPICKGKCKTIFYLQVAWFCIGKIL